MRAGLNQLAVHACMTRATKLLLDAKDLPLDPEILEDLDPQERLYLKQATRAAMVELAKQLTPKPRN